MSYMWNGIIERFGEWYREYLSILSFDNFSDYFTKHDIAAVFHRSLKGYYKNTGWSIQMQPATQSFLAC